MATWKEQLQQIQKLRIARRQGDEQLYAATINLGKTENTLRKIKLGEAGEQERAEEAESKRKELAAQKEAVKKLVHLTTKDLHETIREVYDNADQRKLMSNLDDGIPFLLLPVRIETRFITTGNIAELWLRVYPDDIAIHTHEKTLTDQELTEGQKYWKVLFAAEKGGGQGKEEDKKNAWSAMAASFGGQRSGWIALQTKPLNWSNDLNNITNSDQLDFPVHEITSTGAWSRAPRTNILPDRFVVMLYEGDTMVKEQSGNIIPDELFVGPDPLEADKAFVTLEQEQRLVFGESFEWASNFDKAIENGMGFKITLTPQQAKGGFDKILVLGAYLSADETESQQALQKLIDSHHYSPKGLSIVKQGTATNNTDLDGSGYTRNDATNNISYFVETGEPLFDELGECDGKNLADALGIEYTTLQYISNSDATDHKECTAMNAALYPSTFGYYFDTMMRPVLDEPSQDKLRDFFVQHISGRGPLPAIRVGDQPYGVLLTSDFKKWKWARQEQDFDTAFLNGLYKTISRYRSIWETLLQDIMYIGKPGTNHSEVLMNILGLQPSSVAFYQRIAYSTDDLINRDGFKYGQRYYNDFKDSLDSKNIVLNFLSTLGYDVSIVDGKLTVPQLLRLVYQYGHSTLDASNLIDDTPLSETGGITEYVPGKNYIDWLLETVSIATLEKQDLVSTSGKAPTSLLYMQLRRSLLLELNKASVKWFAKHNIELDQVMKPANFHNIRSGGDLTKWEVMKAKIAVAVPDHPKKEKTVAEYLLTNGTNEQEVAFLNEMKKGMELLAKKSTASLERCFTEHLDTCSYRLDAWETGLFDQRLKKQRQQKNADGQQQRKKGIYIGAYGWVENIRPDSRRAVVQGSIPESLRPANNEPLYEYDDNGGFVHAPSINHATAAAVLRNGYITHATAEEPGTMAVNLSSERVRRAMFVLDGIRNGQTLEALLGYQFERGLHDKGSSNPALKKLNAYIYDFRNAFPVELHQVQQQGSNVVNETIPANNVVNGVRLSEASGFPYGATGGVTAATNDEILAIEDEKDKLDDTLDAIKDLMLSESVYQMVQGNFDRSGAVMNALKDAHIPPEMEVVNTPRSSQFSFTNRVTIQFEELEPADATYNPWPAVAMTPRAMMEPGLNKWLMKILGEPQQLVCLASHIDSGNVEELEEITVDQLQLQPIDLVYIAGGVFNTGTAQNGKENKTAMSELESRITYRYRELKSLTEETRVNIQFLKPGNIVGKRALGSILPLLQMLKSLITDSRALQAEDFNATTDKDNPNPKGIEHQELVGRIQHAQVSFLNVKNDLNAIPIELIDTVGGVSGNITLQQFFEVLDNNHKNIDTVKFNFSSASAVLVKDALAAISAYGIPDTFPQVFSIDAKNKLVLLEQVANTMRHLVTRYEAADKLITDALLPVNTIDKKVASLVEAGKLFFGHVFNIMPLFSYTNVTDIQLSANDGTQLLKYAKDTLKMDLVADEWMQNVSYVRPKLSKWESIRTIYESLTVEAPDSVLELFPVQLPYRKKDSWLAVEFPAKNEDDSPFDITHDTLCVTVHGEGNVFTANKQGGLLIDDWTEMIPVKDEITGISFNYDQPNATPPQTLLLAVPAIEKGNWDWDGLVGILNDTLLRAKLRAVEPDLLNKLDKPEASVLLPALLANFSTFDLDIALDYRTNIATLATAIPILPVGALNE
jgi:hypothetical protein